MPFTPLHVGPSSLVALAFHRKIDLPVFILANVAVDLEPLIIEGLSLNMPLHPVCHSLTVGTLIGLAWACLARVLLKRMAQISHSVKLVYETTFVKMLYSGVLGVWLNVLIDALIYPEIKLLYPLAWNPLYGRISQNHVIFICIISLLPCLVLYRKARRQFHQQLKEL